MGLEFLKTLVLIFGVSACIVFVLHKLRVPSIVGFLVSLSSTAIVMKMLFDRGEVDSPMDASP